MTNQEEKNLKNENEIIVSSNKHFDICSSLLPILRFVLNKKLQQNDSKFAIFYIYIYPKTQSCFFSFSFRATLYFYVMNALVYVDIDQGIH